MGILKREITANKAYNLARSRSVSKKSIGIYKITMPANFVEQPKQEQQEKDNSDYAKVFVRGLHWFATENDLENTLSEFGSIAEISIPKNRNTDKSKGFAFVEFDEHKSVKKALNSEKRLEVKGRRIFLQAFKE